MESNEVRSRLIPTRYKNIQDKMLNVIAWFNGEQVGQPLVFDPNRFKNNMVSIQEEEEPDLLESVVSEFKDSSVMDFKKSEIIESKRCIVITVCI